MSLLISSPQNTRIKQVAKLVKRNHRDRRRATIVEGEREIARALTFGIVPTEAYICSDIAQSDSARRTTESLIALGERGETVVRYVTPDVFAKIAYRTDSGGILLVIPYSAHSLADISFRHTAFLVVIEGVEKPGNLGAILRTADAAGVDAVIVSSGLTDIHNPNVVRASLGALFTVCVVETTTSVAVDRLIQQHVKIVIASPTGAVRYTHTDLTGPVAVVLGSEAQGLSPTWVEKADAQVHIPMRGVIDSLNLSASAALLLYEVVRQRAG